MLRHTCLHHFNIVPSRKASFLNLLFISLVCHSSKTVQQIDVKFGGCIVDDPRMYVCALGAVWMDKVFYINENLRNYTLSAPSSAFQSQTTDSTEQPLQPTLW